MDLYKDDQNSHSGVDLDFSILVVPSASDRFRGRVSFCRRFRFKRRRKKSTRVLLVSSDLGVGGKLGSSSMTMVNLNSAGTPCTRLRKPILVYLQARPEKWQHWLTILVSFGVRGDEK